MPQSISKAQDSRYPVEPPRHQRERWEPPGLPRTTPVNFRNVPPTTIMELQRRHRRTITTATRAHQYRRIAEEGTALEDQAEITVQAFVSPMCRDIHIGYPPGIDAAAVSAALHVASRRTQGRERAAQPRSRECGATWNPIMSIPPGTTDNSKINRNTQNRTHVRAKTRVAPPWTHPCRCIQ